MRQNILNSQGFANLKIYAVWVPFVGGIASAIDPSILRDPRVTQYWDGGSLTSSWFEQHVTQNGFPTYDIYFLYGSDAHWANTPDPLLSSGTTVIARTQELSAALATAGSSAG